jgi:hypothetical protein
MYSSPNIFGVNLPRGMRSLNVAHMGEMSCSYWVLVRKAKGKSPLGIPRRR